MKQPQLYQPAEQEIWKLEEAYIANYMDANHSGILSIYHKDFIGWPDTEPRPARKSDMPEYLRCRFPELSSAEIEIERNGIQIIKDVAINYYTFHLSFINEDGEVIKQSTRMTHTWLREGGQWQILGGMSDNQ